MEQLVRVNAVLASHHRYGLARLQALSNHRRLFLRRPPPPTLRPRHYFHHFLLTIRSKHSRMPTRYFKVETMSGDSGGRSTLGCAALYNVYPHIFVLT